MQWEMRHHIVLKISMYIIYIKYCNDCAGELKYDIALVKLEEEVPTQDTHIPEIQAVPLPPSGKLAGLATARTAIWRGGAALSQVSTKTRCRNRRKYLSENTN